MDKKEIKDHLLRVANVCEPVGWIDEKIKSVEIKVIIDALSEAIKSDPEKFERLIIAYNHLLLVNQRLDVGSLNLPTMVRNAILASGMDHVGCLIHCDINKLSIHNLGKKGKDEIIKALTRFIYNGENDDFLSIVNKAKKLDYIKKITRN